MKTRRNLGRLASLARIPTLVGVAVAVALGAAAPADAATGSWNHVQATCFLGARIQVTSPTMGPAYDGLIGADGTLTIDPPQWVRFRVHVARWNGASWAYYASGPWKAAQVTTAGNNIGDIWLNQQTNRWETGTTVFTVNGSGYYRVYAEYQWYPYYGQPGGYVGFVWTPFHAWNGYMGWGDPWCQFR